MMEKPFSFFSFVSASLEYVSKDFCKSLFSVFKSAPFSLLFKNESGTVSYYVHNMLRIGTVVFLDS